MNDKKDVVLPLRILHLEDSPRDAEIIRERLIDAGFSMQLDWAANEMEFTAFLQRGGYDLILADYQLPGFDAPAALTLAKSLCPEVPFICVSGAVGEEKAVELLMQGATDYVLKSRFDKLPLSIHRALDEVKERTTRQMAEEKLRNNEARFNTLTQTSMDGFWAVDMEGHFLEVNDAYCAMSGYTKEALLSMRVADIEATESPEQVQAHIERLVARGWDRFESRHRRAEGGYIDVQVSTIPLVGQGMIVCFISDITMRKQAEKERIELEKRLVQSQKMEAIGTLAGGIAHDFNNILSAICGYTELAINEEDREKCHQDLEQVLLAAGRATELVKQILAVSRRAEQEKQPLQVAAVIKEALKLLRSSIPTTIEIIQKLTSNGMVLADPTQIHQIIMNLCTNAYHAMREHGGTLAVSLSEVGLQDEGEGYGELAPGRYLKLEVSDTGCGMSPEIKERIFEPYFTTKKIGEGTGLGLAVVHGIIKSYQGHITVYSELGKGTTFHVYLPLIEEKTTELPTKAVVEDLTGKGERILLVDDEAQIRDLAGQIFANNGYRLTVCMNGVQALEEFKAHPGQFDLVITDMTMPHMTGTELAQKIFGIRPDMPIILCTGLSELVNREKALAMGICDYLIKPVFIHDYLSAIRKALRKNKSQTLPD